MPATTLEETLSIAVFTVLVSNVIPALAVPVRTNDLLPVPPDAVTVSEVATPNVVRRSWVVPVSEIALFFSIESSATTGAHLIRDIVDVSLKGRAPKQEMTMMSLAAAIVFPPDNA